MLLELAEMIAASHIFPPADGELDQNAFAVSPLASKEDPPFPQCTRVQQLFSCFCQLVPSQYRSTSVLARKALIVTLRPRVLVKRAQFSFPPAWLLQYALRSINLPRNFRSAITWNPSVLYIGQGRGDAKVALVGYTNRRISHCSSSPFAAP